MKFMMVGIERYCGKTPSLLVSFGVTIYLCSVILGPL